MIKTIKITEKDLNRIVNEAIEEMYNFGKLRQQVLNHTNGGAFSPSLDKFNPQNPRHLKGYDVIRDWVDYMCQKHGEKEQDIIKLLTHDVFHNYSSQEKIHEIKQDYKNVYYYCVNTLKLRPGVIADIAKNIGEDLEYGMLN